MGVTPGEDEVKRRNLPFLPFCSQTWEGTYCTSLFLCFSGLAKNFLLACGVFFTCTYIMHILLIAHGKCMATIICVVCAKRVQRYNNWTQAELYLTLRLRTAPCGIHTACYKVAMHFKCKLIRVHIFLNAGHMCKHSTMTQRRLCKIFRVLCRGSCIYT